MCLSIGTPKIINFPFVPNGKFIVLGVPKSRHITLIHKYASGWVHLKTIDFTFGTNGK